MFPRLFNIDTAALHGLLPATGMTGQGAELLRMVAPVPRRIFGLTSPLAPGLSFVGAQAPLWTDAATGAAPLVSSSGVGLALLDALVSCLGETVERVSQAEQDGDVVFRGSVVQAIDRVDPAVSELVRNVCRQNSIDADTVIDWVRGHQSEAERDVLIPADWCLRRRQDGPLKMANTPLSVGAAAGPTAAEARSRAVMELVERDAIAQWWIGGRRGRPVPLEVTAEAQAVFTSSRGGVAVRTSWLLDVTTDLDIPSIVALSVDAEGRGLACGMAARATMAQAARAAIFEMCQMELALLVVDLKRHESGDDALNAVDRKHLLRALMIDANTCQLLHPAGAPRPMSTPSAADRIDPVVTLADVTFVDLTRAAHGIPVIAAIAPALQRFPGEVRTARTSRAIDEHGGGERWTQGISLA